MDHLRAILQLFMAAARSGSSRGRDCPEPSVPGARNGSRRTAALAFRDTGATGGLISCGATASRIKIQNKIS